MNRKQKQALVVGVALLALILFPVVLWILSGLAGGNSDPQQRNHGKVASAGSGTSANFELSQLAERAQSLIETGIVEAVRSGDLSVDLLADLQEDLGKAQSDLNSGHFGRSESRFQRIVASAEAELAEVAIADQARALRASAMSELKRLESLKGAFENTYSEAVENFDSASLSVDAGDFQVGAEGFELTLAILGDLDARAIRKVASLIEQGDRALESFDLRGAEEAYTEVLEIDPSNADAKMGLEVTSALDGIAESVQEILNLEEEGRLDEAKEALESLAAENPNNPVVQELQRAMAEREIEREFEALVAESVRLEGSGDFAAAIAALEKALALKQDPQQLTRLAELKEKDKALQLERMLAKGFDDLKAGRYESARDVYREAVALAPESSEARTGLERASSLYLASIRYTQNMNAVERRIAEGRFPLAAKQFNEAMASRPAQLAPEAQGRENSIREQLEAQSEEQAISITSDRRTYVSVIGVFAPERFREKDLILFPDVYKVRGTRSGFKSVEVELKVDATDENRRTIHIECTDRI